MLKGRVIQPLLKLLYVQHQPAVMARQLFRPECLNVYVKSQELSASNLNSAGIFY